jgi:hypothetical protein
MTNKLRQWVLHPLLFAIYPVLALLASNISQVKPSAALRPLGVAVAAAFVTWGITFYFSRDLRRSALLVSWWLVLFFSYGHVYNFLEQNSALGRHRLLLPIWILLAAAGSWWLVKKLKDFAYATLALNGIGLVLLVFPLLQLGSYGLRSQLHQGEGRNLPAGFEFLQVPQGQTPPDVYYIILDAYARNDVLQFVFAYKNTVFSNWLRQNGFYLASCSQSNYSQTELSLASSLNLTYLDDLVGPLPADSQDRLPLRSVLRYNAVRQAFQQLGYNFVAFETGFLFSQFEDADIYLASGSLGGMSGFEVLLVKTSGGLAMVDAATVLPRFFQEDLLAPETARYRQVVYTLDQLSKVPSTISGPKFVFAHIVAPHGPLVFGSSGEQVHNPEPLNDASYTQAYRSELDYLNGRMQEVLQRILADSAVPPIIILQADHGHDMASPEDRMAILNAYYLPGEGEDQPYPAITPVNSFRLVFNRYFGGQFLLLEDRSYFSYYQEPFSFRPIPNRCK